MKHCCSFLSALAYKEGCSPAGETSFFFFIFMVGIRRFQRSGRVNWVLFRGLFIKGSLWAEEWLLTVAPELWAVVHICIWAMVWAGPVSVKGAQKVKKIGEPMFWGRTLIQTLKRIIFHSSLVLTWPSGDFPGTRVLSCGCTLESLGEIFLKY